LPTGLMSPFSRMRFQTGDFPKRFSVPPPSGVQIARLPIVISTSFSLLRPPRISGRASGGVLEFFQVFPHERNPPDTSFWRNSYPPPRNLIPSIWFRTKLPFSQLFILRFPPHPGGTLLSVSHRHGSPLPLHLPPADFCSSTAPCSFLPSTFLVRALFLLSPDRRGVFTFPPPSTLTPGGVRSYHHTLSKTFSHSPCRGFA